MIRFRRRVNGLVTAVMALLAVGFLFIEQHRRDVIIARYCANRLRHVEQTARDATEVFNSIANALSLVGHLMLDTPGGAPPRELGAYRAAMRQFHMINVYDPRGRLVHSVYDPRQLKLPLDQAQALQAEVARKTALQVPFQVHTSQVRSLGDGWYQSFGLAYGPGGGQANLGVVVLLVDHRRYFEAELKRTTESRSALLLLDDYGRPAPQLAHEISDLLAGQQDDASRASEADQLLRRLSAHERGTLELGLSRHLRWLDGPQVIAAFAPIPARHGGAWTIARLTNAELLREELAAGQLRLTVAYAIMCVLLLGARLAVLGARRRGESLAERLRQAEELAHLTEKTDKIIDTIPCGVMTLSSEERISSLNHFLRQRVPAMALGQPLGAAFPEAPRELRERLAELAHSALTSDKVVSLFGEPMALFGADGQYNVHAVPLEPRFPDSRLLLVIEDLSDVGSLAAQLLRTEKMATVGVLAAGVAHEVGTPLSIVRGRAEYLLGKLGHDHGETEAARQMITQVDLVSRTLRQLLDFARVKGVKERAVPLRLMAGAVAELLRFEASRHGARIVTEVPEALPLLGADPDQLQQVLVNLVLNACDACQRRGPGGEIRIHAELPRLMESGEWSSRSVRAGLVHVLVSDNGCGIPREDLHRVFDPFFTTKQRGLGTGLGLTIVAQIVRDHGGEIEIRSELGQGTRVLLRWPRARAGAERTSSASLEALRSGEHSARVQIRSSEPR